MQFEDVELVGGHLVDDLEESLLAEEVPAEIDQEAAPAKTRRITDVHGQGHCDRTSSQLAKRLRSIEEPSGIGGFDQHVLPATREDDSPRDWDPAGTGTSESRILRAPRPPSFSPNARAT